jgi:hypothetical protein
VSNAAVIAGLLDDLAACLTDAQMRAWLIASADFRAMMPEMVLERVEAERRRQEAFVAEAEDQARRKERARAVKGQQGGHRPSLLIAAARVMARFNMPETAFGRLAANDPRLIRDLRGGRIPGPRLQARVMAWIERQEAPHA